MSPRPASASGTESGATFHRAAGHYWRVTEGGTGSDILLLHGTGASAHSWDYLSPILHEAGFRTVAPDLPGHGATDLLPARRMTLEAIATGVGELIEECGYEPKLVIGHSAGAAIALQMTMKGLIDPRGIISINGAFQPFGSFAAPLLSGAARLLAHTPLVSFMLSMKGNRNETVSRVIEQTGSQLQPEALDAYRLLAGRPRHVTGALRMMAAWDLRPLWYALPHLEVPLHLITGLEDKAVPPRQAHELADRVHGAKVHEIQNAGHLGHEEAPEIFAACVLEIAENLGLPAG
ncbi:putative magnesium chelatase accessory protein [Luminiphilus syltensis NOR5-1B]|uniref:Putative magnesium chelatase accessory protein n=1 Tax=Luminiphilus syltensis NOR5-1B TaxID=565045 RepID=B8KT15_9GAMM|nr:alpha/beta fold hydrolase BchO [Luminiphilus syltensis]EED34098.1 putative magnesium chelatase accessory protein [Luminiphilus syltensis NOR5-1B]